jgi:hypothetical protein
MYLAAVHPRKSVRHKLAVAAEGKRSPVLSQGEKLEVKISAALVAAVSEAEQAKRGTVSDCWTGSGRRGVHVLVRLKLNVKVKLSLCLTKHHPMTTHPSLN